MPKFPETRMRRLRANTWSRRLVRESQVAVDDLIWPIFVVEGQGQRVAIPSMPGVFRMSLDVAGEAVAEAESLGIPSVAVFPVIDMRYKTPGGELAFDPDNLVCRALRHLSKVAPGVGLISDVALDPFTSHGQDGIVENGLILNDETIEALRQQAVVQAAAGSQIVAPSDMMDGRIGGVRQALDRAGLQSTMVLSYAAKYASAFYGPFRDAVGSKAALGAADKRTYQMDPGNRTEAIREVALDIEEGADMVMVKPGLPYLDIVKGVKENFGLPTFVYQVSGEYSMLHAAAAQGWLDLEKTRDESLLAFKRAGADAILTYFAVEVARALRAGTFREF
jgi:porphobilinogen synthase